MEEPASQTKDYEKKKKKRYPIEEGGTLGKKKGGNQKRYTKNTILLRI